MGREGTMEAQQLRASASDKQLHREAGRPTKVNMIFMCLCRQGSRRMDGGWER